MELASLASRDAERRQTVYPKQKIPRRLSPNFSLNQSFSTCCVLHLDIGDEYAYLESRTPVTVPLDSKRTVLLFGGVILIVNAPERALSTTVYLPSILATALLTTSFPLGETDVGTDSVWNRNFSNRTENSPGLSVRFHTPYPSLALEKLGGLGSPAANRIVLVSVSVPPG